MSHSISQQQQFVDHAIALGLQCDGIQEQYSTKRAYAYLREGNVQLYVFSCHQNSNFVQMEYLVGHRSYHTNLHLETFLQIDPVRVEGLRATYNNMVLEHTSLTDRLTKLPLATRRIIGILLGECSLDDLS